MYEAKGTSEIKELKTSPFDENKVKEIAEKVSDTLLSNCSPSEICSIMIGVKDVVQKHYDARITEMEKSLDEFKMASKPIFSDL